NANVRDCLVTGYEALIDAVKLPDPDDRHVLAAAIRGRADVIVTFDLDDFPADALQPYGIDAQHPDDFVTHLLDLAPTAVYRVEKRRRKPLKTPPKPQEDPLPPLKGRRLVQTVARLRMAIDLL